MAMSFIGKPISLISHSDVRYRGILAGIDPAASTIQLSNVYSMGTETRRPPEEFIPPVQEPYQYIIFRASEVKDLAVDDPAPRRNIHDDPAVLGASAPAGAPPFNQYGQPGFPQAAGPGMPAPVVQQPVQQQQFARPADGASPSQQPRAPSTSNGVNGDRRNGVTSAVASLDTVERALGDLRVAQGARGGRRGRQELKAGDLRVPSTDFDFASSNARFDKTAVAGGSKSPQPARSEAGDGSPGAESADGQETAEKEEEDKAYYNPQKSFFDSLSSSAQGLPGGQGGGRGRGRGGGRNRREEERERNVATFGEPGGVGLMGPGAYVGGWGGYGRRGGGRGRRNPQGAR